MNMPSPLRDFFELPYEQLEELNLEAKAERSGRTPMDKLQEKRLRYLTDTKGIKAVTVCFSDLEGRLHMLDYDKKFLVKSADNLTFDGSSIRGFTAQAESDLRLGLDWGAFYWLPSDIFGSGKVLVFGDVIDKDGSPYAADMRAQLKAWTNELYEKQGLTLNAANEIEGFLFKGRNAEQYYAKTGRFEFASEGGYYHSLPSDSLRQFIDTVAEVQRAMGFANEKDHPEVAPAQFEINYSYTEASIAADQISLYKLIARQVAAKLDMTASFLPKPVTGVNGNGMHTNLSISKEGKNLFYDPSGEEGLSPLGWQFIERILTSANDICLVLNSSVNAYRRLDPHFEAPNEIKASPVDRGSMVRIPIGNEKSARVEVRSVGPDASPYMTLLTVLKTGLEGPHNPDIRNHESFLPDNILTALRNFTASEYTATLLGTPIRDKFAELKQNAADRSPAKLGSIIKPSEIQYHHEVYNQLLWTDF